MIRRLLLITMWLGLGHTARADEPTSGFKAFHQFRVLSGLSGSTFGTDPDGRLSQDGPTAFSTPVAHTLGRNTWWLAGGQYSFSEDSVVTRAKGNWTILSSYGATADRFNVLGTVMMVNEKPEAAVNLQFQWIPPEGSRLVFSGGVQNLPGSIKSTDADNQQALSLFGVATYRIETGHAPLYVSAGIGTRRFRTLFGSASWKISRGLRLWAEHDTFDVNAGLLWSTVLPGTDRELNVLMGRAKGRYFLFSMGLRLK